MWKWNFIPVLGFFFFLSNLNKGNDQNVEKTAKEKATQILVNTWAWKYQWVLELISQNGPGSPWLQLVFNIFRHSLLTDYFVAD